MASELPPPELAVQSLTSVAPFPTLIRHLPTPLSYLPYPSYTTISPFHHIHLTSPPPPLSRFYLTSIPPPFHLNLTSPHICCHICPHISGRPCALLSLCRPRGASLSRRRSAGTKRRPNEWPEECGRPPSPALRAGVAGGRVRLAQWTVAAVARIRPWPSGGARARQVRCGRPTHNLRRARRSTGPRRARGQPHKAESGPVTTDVPPTPAENGPMGHLW